MTQTGLQCQVHTGHVCKSVLVAEEAALEDATVPG